MRYRNIRIEPERPEDLAGDLTPLDLRLLGWPRAKPVTLHDRPPVHSQPSAVLAQVSCATCWWPGEGGA